MKELFLGEAVRQQRLAMGLTQEELCEGICEPITVSRFENGKQTPSRNRVIAILQRLGMPSDRFYALLSAKETELADIEKEITSCHVRFERASHEEKSAIREEAFALHRRLESVMEPDDTLSRQLILRSRFLLGTENGPYSLSDGLELLLQAIRLTSPHFDLDRIGQGLYTENEIKLINNIGTCYMRAGRHYDAIDVYKPLLRYLQTNWKKIPADRAHIPLVAFNYARELLMVKRYDKAIEIAEYARGVCVNYGYYLLLPALLHILAECYFNEGERAKSEKLFRQAYYLYEATEDESDRLLLVDDVRKLLGIEIE